MATITAGNTPQELKAIEAVDTYQRQIVTIRTDPTLSDTGRRQKLAAAYISTRDTVTKLQNDATTNADARRDTLTSSLFGLTTTADPTAAISLRDAQDRATALTDPREAQRLLEQASRTGDDHLAKAIAHRAYEDGWYDVLNTYAATRTNVEAQIGELRNLEPNIAHTIGAAMSYAVIKPTELASLSDPAIADLAAGRSTEDDARHGW
ncbi:hypothetical protein [Oerskovia sp. USHLN155]|uniref:hypothetical protein n=1 Tax=Oerskovia sp. USHLN155 TaxID=3081288 RepID=UPI003017B01C